MIKSRVAVPDGIGISEDFGGGGGVLSIVGGRVERRGGGEAGQWGVLV